MSLPASVGRIPIASNSDGIPVQPTPIEAKATAQPSGSDAAVDDIDRSFHAALARLTGGISPAALALAFADWQLHLLASPGKQASLAERAIQNGFDLVDAMVPRHAADPRARPACH
nr:poly-beta-hydroxybutyrate polymerase N-terminal domain-containing protein [Bradyrhizobium sp. CCBAU 65884]